jgi:pilus assembly protein FimV
MRAEFESVAKNLNQNFNVEVQAWDAEKTTPHTSIDLVLDEPVEAANTVPVAPKPESLEDLPRIMAIVVQMWKAGDVVGYLYQLLRDNRGGQRVGFALPVVEEILFLIELKETSHRMEMEPSAS